MPRPLNMTGEVGTYKGVGTVSQEDLDATGISSGEWSQAIEQLNMSTWGPNMAGELTLPFVKAGLKSNTVGQWLQDNATWLLIGGVVGLLLFRR